MQTLHRPIPVRTGGQYFIILNKLSYFGSRPSQLVKKKSKNQNEKSETKYNLDLLTHSEWEQPMISETHTTGTINVIKDFPDLSLLWCCDVISCLAYLLSVMMKICRLVIQRMWSYVTQCCCGTGCCTVSCVLSLPVHEKVVTVGYLHISWVLFG